MEKTDSANTHSGIFAKSHWQSLGNTANTKAPGTNEVPGRSRGIQGEGQNWVLIVGGALLSTLSIRLGNGKSNDRKKLGSCNFHSNAYCFSHNEDGCYDRYPGSIEIKQQCNGQMLTESEMALPLATAPASEFSKENGEIWASSPDRLELPPKPFHQSNSSDSPCVSEAGSDIFSKREVIQKLRQQLKRR
ncbi:hypothetical protein Fot_20710 [Forsythia ovata]|uniref:Uncharacterized protein n=1 Tax=Forsythia ovata TaxID=205694 RepID=A0ABD1USX9_9LAMI